MKTTPINKLTFLAFYLNGAAGSGKYPQLTIAVVKQAIEQGTVFQFLKDTLGNDLDISLFTDAEKSELSEEWESYANAVDESRKMAVTAGGLNLLVAYLLEGVQIRFGEQRRK